MRQLTFRRNFNLITMALGVYLIAVSQNYMLGAFCLVYGVAVATFCQVKINNLNKEQSNANQSR